MITSYINGNMFAVVTDDDMAAMKQGEVLVYEIEQPSERIVLLQATDKKQAGERLMAFVKSLGASDAKWEGDTEPDTLGTPDRELKKSKRRG